MKISGAYRSSKLAPDYSDVVPLAKALIAANPGSHRLGHRLAASEFGHPARQADHRRDAAVPDRRRPPAQPAAGLGAGRRRAQDNPGRQSRAALRVWMSRRSRRLGRLRSAEAGYSRNQLRALRNPPNGKTWKPAMDAVARAARLQARASPRPVRYRPEAGRNGRSGCAARAWSCRCRSGARILSGSPASRGRQGQWLPAAGCRGQSSSPRNLRIGAPSKQNWVTMSTRIPLSRPSRANPPAAGRWRPRRDRDALRGDRRR